ncbi:MAG: hypothetical protein R3F62_02440 [Planctomycetota bacterium]
MRHTLTRSAFLLALGLAAGSPAWAQFVSGSDGSDGALNVAGGQGTVIFDPGTLGIDGDGDRVFHFTTVSVGAGTTLRLSAGVLGEGRPVVWLATGAVQIDGVLDLSGAPGHSTAQPALPSDAGAGGFSGGTGVTASNPDPTGGAGPGGGGAAAGQSGGGAGHLAAGVNGTGGVPGGEAYGSRFGFPLLGGSGGGGGGTGAPNGPGGGAGGGALLIASSGSISIAGTVNASGGAAGSNGAGRGSGGTIRLMAPTVTLASGGTLNVNGGLTTGTAASAGRIRIEGFTRTLEGSVLPLSSASYSTPGLVFPPANAPTVRVTQVAGQALPTSPTGSVITPDVTINQAGPVQIDVAATNIPPGTQVTVRVVPENGTPLNLTATLSGTQASSTAQINASLPSGISRFFVNAT